MELNFWVLAPTTIYAWLSGFSQAEGGGGDRREGLLGEEKRRDDPSPSRESDPSPLTVTLRGLD